MGKFDSLSKSKSSKRVYKYDFSRFYKNDRLKTSVDYNYYESLYVQELWNKNEKKYNRDLITLWGKLDMRSYIDYMIGNTYNLYFTEGSKRIPINQLDDYNYMHEDARNINLLDIKYIKHLTLENIKFDNLFLATFEILDNDKKFRPYVLLYTKNLANQFVEIGYGYDSNNNGNIELFIKSFNYPIFLTLKGYILLPLAKQKIKLDVYDYITDADIQKIMGQSN